MSSTGNIKISPLAKELGVSVAKVKDVIKFLEDKNEYN
jgi:DNA-binding MarR family transcriptional regulator